MSDHHHAPEEQYAKIVQQMLAEDPLVSSDNDPTKKRFGRSGELKMTGKMFAFLARGRLIIKLPRQRVDSLVAAGHGERCDMGRGRLMKEWIAVGPDFVADWHALANEAKVFVSSRT